MRSKDAKGKEMTTEVTIQSEASHRARTLIDEGKNDAVGGFIKIGAGFNLVAEHRLHRLENKTFAEYIAETGMSWAKAHQAMKVHAVYGHMDVHGILHSRLIELSPISMTEVQKAEAISAARELGPRDFERFIAEKKGKTVPALCEHKNLVTICSDCRAKMP
jgi:hypothetical protein